MGWINKRITCLLLYLMVISAGVFTSCSISYKFNGAAIDYDVIKTLTIEEIPNQAPLVYPPLSQTFTENLRTQFRRQTRLEEAQDGDLIIDGAIVGYDLTPVAVQADAFAALTKVTLTVKINFTNQVFPEKSFTNRTFSAYTEFDSGLMFSSIEEGLVKDLVDDIIKQIFNATVEDW